MEPREWLIQLDSESQSGNSLYLQKKKMQKKLINVKQEKNTLEKK